MNKITIYKYISDEGNTIITPINLKIGDPTITYRLVAENEKILTDGSDRKHVVEVTEGEVSSWKEVELNDEEKAELEKAIKNDDNAESAEEEDTNEKYKTLLDIITGEVE